MHQKNPQTQAQKTYDVMEILELLPDVFELPTEPLDFVREKLYPGQKRLEALVLVNRHLLVVAAPLDYSSQFLNRKTLHKPPNSLIKYSESKYAPHNGRSLKLGTLHHYRKNFQELEGIGDSWEGTFKVKSTLEEFYTRHNIPINNLSTPLCDPRLMEMEVIGNINDGPIKVFPNFVEYFNEFFNEFFTRHGISFVEPPDLHLGKIETTYEVQSDSFIYCTALQGSEMPQGYDAASVILNPAKFAKHLGIEFARQVVDVSDEDFFKTDNLFREYPELDSLYREKLKSARPPLKGVIQVFHGPVIYSDEPKEPMFEKLSMVEANSAIFFLKRTQFASQREYRFVISYQSKTPIQETVFLNITPELKSFIKESM